MCDEEENRIKNVIVSTVSGIPDMSSVLSVYGSMVLMSLGLVIESDIYNNYWIRRKTKDAKWEYTTRDIAMDTAQSEVAIVPALVFDDLIRMIPAEYTNSDNKTFPLFMNTFVDNDNLIKYCMRYEDGYGVTGDTPIACAFGMIMFCVRHGIINPSSILNAQKDLFENFIKDDMFKELSNILSMLIIFMQNNCIGNNSIESAIGNLDILSAYARRLNNG